MHDAPHTTRATLDHNPHWPRRVIIHLDLDAFFAQVEALDNPALRGKPVIVGGKLRPDGTVGRGVVTTASYEARKFGVHSAMPLATAHRLCPHAHFISNRFDRYRSLAARVFETASRFSPAIQRTGIDEGYIEATGLRRWLTAQLAAPPPDLDRTWPTILAARLKRAVLDDTGLTCSLGVAPTHFLAKIASDHNKPDAVTTVAPADAPAFIAPLPISSLRGVGPVTARRLETLGYRTGADLVNDSREHVTQLLGDFGARLWDASHAIDVGQRHEGFAVRSSGDGVNDAQGGSGGKWGAMSRETTFPADTSDRALLLATLADLTQRLAYRLRTRNLRAGCVSIKLRFADFTTLTRDRSLADPAAGAIGFSDNEADILPVASALLANILQRHPLADQPVRLLGVKLAHLSSNADRQLRLSEADSFERRDALARAADAIRARHGYDAITSAHATQRPRRRRKPTQPDPQA